MGQLRLQMDNAMLVRGMAERTRETYLARRVAARAGALVCLGAFGPLLRCDELAVLDDRAQTGPVT